MAYRPSFKKDEFHHNTGHYEINLGGRKILYAYIRKNACTAFRRLLNDEYHRLHPPAEGKKQRSREDFLLSGNMKEFLVLRKNLRNVDAYDNTVFVYRDPLDRLISVFTNKFIADKGAKDIKRNFEGLTGLRFDDATFDDFIDYAKHDFKQLDRHLWPQKAHLWDIKYTDAIRIDHLQQSMRSLIGPGRSRKWFGRKVNSSMEVRTASSEVLTSVPVSDLRHYQVEGRELGKKNFTTEKVREFVAERYSQDVEMISAIEVVSRPDEVARAGTDGK
ncbi:sulfotransferase family 2 domain-containing protein [Roseovarius sp.]|uniref:sulfotransferase family 2 domain-containing protein n=1 Tax=Roseovarius sp. TaxID=1486281 RepID=UPI0026359C50|nr:sulfotransferase family 2 domain-containing protein [Roseovarius sp.]MDM8167643.1 sulfotransferase family 2 domain-containing protein [Roseovarius sp.]